MKNKTDTNFLPSESINWIKKYRERIVIFAGLNPGPHNTDFDGSTSIANTLIQLIVNIKI